MTSAALAHTEAAQLRQYEATIERGMVTFIEVGHALAAIRDAKLYRFDFGTFEEYCTTKWGLARRRAYQYIEAATAAENVYQGTQITPISERQVRPLTRLAANEQSAAWERATELAADEGTPVRSRHVERAVEERAPRNMRAVDAPPPADSLIEYWRTEYEKMRGVVEDTLADGHPATVLSRIWAEAARPMIRELEKFNPKSGQA